MKLQRLLYLVLLGVLLFGAYWYCFPYAEKTAVIMDTPVTIKIEAWGAPKLAGEALAEIKRLEKLFNKFDPQSEVSKLNAASSLEAREISPDTAKILKMSEDLKNISNGAFDITLGGRGEFKNKIDLGGIAKGYAAETIRRQLNNAGVKSALIDMRSTIAAIGPKEWLVGIRHPRQKEQLLGRLKLWDGQSVSTSGDYERGKHIINPKTGKPAELCMSVTILGTDAAVTDALATAVFVLGPKDGLRLIENSHGIEGLIIDANGNIVRSAGFELE